MDKKLFKIEKDGKFFYMQIELPNDLFMSTVLDNGYSATEKTEQDMMADYKPIMENQDREAVAQYQAEFNAFLNEFQKLYMQKAGM